MKNETYALFLDSWGTPARHEDEYPCQAHFLSALHELAIELPEVQVFHAGDVAYCYSSNLAAVASFGMSAFKKMCFANDSFIVRPIRAGLAKGTQAAFVANLDKAPNLHSSAILGRGNVEAARLEKSGQKGMRFFLTNEVAADLAATPGKWLTRECATKGFEHHELNWMGIDLLSEDFLGTLIDGRPLRVLVLEHARSLLETNDNYSQQLGSSLLDLSKWSAKF